MYKPDDMNIFVGKDAGLNVTNEKGAIMLGKDGIFTLYQDGTLVIRGDVVLVDKEMRDEFHKAIRMLCTNPL